VEKKGNQSYYHLPKHSVLISPSLISHDVFFSDIISQHIIEVVNAPEAIT
jgi:hypothetical protein